MPTLLIRLHGLAFGMAVLACWPSAWADDQFVPAKATVYTYRDSSADTDKPFGDPRSACVAYTRYASPGSTFLRLDEYQRGDSSVRCVWRTKDGNEDGMTGVYAHLECPTNAHSRQSDAVRTGKCECESGFVARGAQCASPDEAASSQTAAPGSASPSTSNPGAASTPPDDCAGRQGGSPGNAAARPTQAKAARMPEHRAQCFSIDAFQDKAQLKEFAAQLRRQQDALNQMTVGDFISGMSWYAAKRQEGARVPRKGEEAKQKAMREQYRSTIKASMVKSLQCSGMSKSQAEAQAETRLPQVMGRLQALHEPDIALTGGEVTRLGDARVNGEIGRQWAEPPGGRYSDDSRRYRLLADVMQAQSSVSDKALLNVVLEPCRR